MRAADKFDASKTTHIVYAPPPAVGHLPEWIVANNDGSLDKIEIDITDEAPEEFIQAYFRRDPDVRKKVDPGRVRYNAEGIWNDLVNMLESIGTAPELYRWAGRRSDWQEALKLIGVMSKSEPIGWYDLDSGLVDFASLYDAVYVDQPRLHGKKKRKLFMMTEEMWVNGEYPPEVGGRTTSKEARRRA